MFLAILSRLKKYCLTSVNDGGIYNASIIDQPFSGGMSESASGDGRRNRGMLASYYGMESNPTEPHVNGDVDPNGAAVGSSSADEATGSSAQPVISDNPCDIDSPAFNPELYLNKMMKEKGLTELMDSENDMVRRK